MRNEAGRRGSQEEGLGQYVRFLAASNPSRVPTL